MKESTKKFCEGWEKSKNTRSLIKAQVLESRFYGYASLIKTNPAVAKLAKDGKQKELQVYLKQNISSLGIPVNLTDLGLRRVATALILMFKQEG